ncbi:hypothetical protein PHISCL_08814 [Aspergillus sclerotialis]|uniref:Uncharacterized protein n=1 Tax=Aspergillus sclerotialis TaxID=2070753 RepID=A0A3A2Z6Y2_9EURO|nr:hypothetical protein PHISCL_08814 [Aspergillus sclerotialis]
MNTDPPNQVPDDNKTLLQISSSLTNALNTFGASSPQYQTVLEILKECLRDIDRDKQRHAASAPDPDMLSLAMGFLEIAD